MKSENLYNCGNTTATPLLTHAQPWRFFFFRGVATASPSLMNHIGISAACHPIAWQRHPLWQ